MSHFFDQPQHAQACKLARQRRRRDGHVRGQVCTAQTVNIELAMLQCLQQPLFHRIEEVQALDRLLRVDAYAGLAQALQITLACAGVIQAAKKRQIALVAAQQYFAQIDQAVDRLLEPSKLSRTVPVSVFHLAVVLKERNVVDCRFDTQHSAEFVVNLHAGRTHAVLDAAPFNAGRQARTNFLRQRWRDLLAQKAGDPRRICRQYRLAAQAVVQRRQDVCALEHQVGGILNLADAPVVALAKHIQHGTKPLGINVQPLVQNIGTQSISQRLGARQIVDAQKSVVGLRKIDAFALERLGQCVVAVAVKLRNYSGISK